MRHVRSVLVAGAVAVAAAACGLVPFGPDAAPRPRPKPLPPPATEAVYLVHGVQWDGTSDCAKTWRVTLGELRRHGFRGEIVTWGYYRDDTNCTRVVPGTRDTPLKELSRQLAWDIYRNHTSRGRPVAVLGHSMGGLVAAAAVAGVRKYGGRSPAWPPSLRVRNAVSLAAPYQGMKCRFAYKQCGDLRKGSPFLRWLATVPHPQGEGGTDWTLFSAEDDGPVKVPSALAARARHKITYLRGQGVGHTRVRNLGGPAPYRLRYSHTWGGDVRETADGMSPMRQAAHALYSTDY
ncbi:alpha/beta hydrolase [Actinomadura kijaniata]|uniref:alpha/beta hydrolase n=1 Tax=Actinomadura kijaniata TaxID=46161 RepID=UPI0008376643|nr:hypothetical protein [Actinomadura kijaniata]